MCALSMAPTSNTRSKDVDGLDVTYQHGVQNVIALLRPVTPMMRC